MLDPDPDEMNADSQPFRETLPLIVQMPGDAAATGRGGRDAAQREGLQEVEAGYLHLALLCGRGRDVHQSW